MHAMGNGTNVQRHACKKATAQNRAMARMQKTAAAQSCNGTHAKATANRATAHTQRNKDATARMQTAVAQSYNGTHAKGSGSSDHGTHANGSGSSINGT